MKYELGQTLYTVKGQAVKIEGRTEFNNGREPRYYITSETAFPGKNVGEDWCNESALTTEAPPEPEAEADPEAELTATQRARKRSKK